MRWVLIYLLAFANLMTMVSLGLNIVGANAYDMQRFYREAKNKRHSDYRRRKTPLVSIVIPAHNEEVVITRTLDSVRASSYTNIEIIVVDDGSTDNTRSIIRDYIKKLVHTKTTAVMDESTHTPARRAPLKTGRAKLVDKRSRYYSRRFERLTVDNVRIVGVWQRNGGKASAMNNAIANYALGEFVMCLDADSVLHPKAIERAVAYFRNPKVIGVAANVRVMESKSMLGTLQRFEHMVGYRSKKFYSITNSEFIIGGVASTYRMKALKKVGFYDTDTFTEDIGLSLKLLAASGNKKVRIVYAADVVAMTEGVETYGQLLRQRYRWKMGCLQNIFKYRRLILNQDSSKYSRLLTMYRLPMSLVGEVLLILQPVLLGYIVYLSVRWHTLNIVLGGYLIITLYVMWTVWPDEHLSVREKLKMSRRALSIYVLFYAMDLVQIVAIFHCLKEYKRITMRTGATTWISPTRAGQAVGTT